jgi:hypothetical protein
MTPSTSRPLHRRCIDLTCGNNEAPAPLSGKWEMQLACVGVYSCERISFVWLGFFLHQQRRLDPSQRGRSYTHTQRKKKGNDSHPKNAFFSFYFFSRLFSFLSFFPTHSIPCRPDSLLPPTNLGSI